MITHLRLLRNVGMFDSVADGANFPLDRLTLIYAENGKGKTTLSAIMRSLATGNPVHVLERRRLGVQHAPQVVLECAGGPPAAVFRGNAWSRTLPNVVVFDDAFVDQNVYSGLAVEPGHRQNMHELIVSSQAVDLNRELQRLVEEIEEHNGRLRTKAAAIPAADRGALSVDQFCALRLQADVDVAIQAAERALAAAREQQPVQQTQGFDPLSLPAFDVPVLEELLSRDLPRLDATAAARVQEHLAGLGPEGERWVAQGMRLVRGGEEGRSGISCPFCAQDVEGSPVMNHYRAYFSEAYAGLKQAVSDMQATLSRTHGGDAAATFERSVRAAVERRQFWGQFCDVPAIHLDTAAIVGAWRAARDAAVEAFNAKRAAPLERAELGAEALAAIAAYEEHRQAVAAVSLELQQANLRVRTVKEQAAAGTVPAHEANLVRLRSVKARHAPATAALCQDYLDEKRAKAETERRRNETREALDERRGALFPAYEQKINDYLERFGVGFRLHSVCCLNTRGGSTCTYSVLVNNTAVPVGSGAAVGEPAFHNILSAGDRNTLALAFFFALLDQDPLLAEKVVVIDDPISSLDEHRSLTTTQELRRLAERAAQVIVLSHSKPFLARLWTGADGSMRVALEIARQGQGSTLRRWDVNQDSITEHDRRHTALRSYLAGAGGEPRDVARSIRPLLEAFFRVACPEHFPPGTLLGPFRSACQQRLGTPNEILEHADLQELRDILEYANRFHHDTNPAWETEVINEGELTTFVRRALRLAGP